jgi:hypothetical protein
MADDSALKLVEFTELDYGRPVQRVLALDVDHDNVNETSTTHSAPNTTITVTGASYTTDVFKGMQLTVADPANGDFIVGTVQSNTATTIVVSDSSQDIIDAIEISDLSFVIYDFVDTNVLTTGTYHTAGFWTSAPAYNGGSDITVFTEVKTKDAAGNVIMDP